MIKIDKYCSNFEEEYWEIVNSKIASDVQEKIIKESKAILPEDFYTGPENPFKQLILAPFSKLKIPRSRWLPLGWIPGWHSVTGPSLKA